MKQLIVTLSIVFLSTNLTFSQKISLEFNLETNFNNINFFDGSTSVGDPSYGDFLFNFSLGANAQIKDNFYLKTIIGTNDFNERIDFVWRNESNSDNIRGWMNGNQNYLEVLPEFRFLENNLFFINAGIGFSTLKTDRLNNAYWRINVNFPSTEILFYDLPAFTNSYVYFAGNAGVNLMIDKIGFLASAGLRRSQNIILQEDFPTMKLNQLILKLGVSYKLH